MAIPVIENVGVDIKASEKSAVIVTVSDCLTLRLLEVEDKFEAWGEYIRCTHFYFFDPSLKGSFGAILPEGEVNSTSVPNYTISGCF